MKTLLDRVLAARFLTLLLIYIISCGSFECAELPTATTMCEVKSQPEKFLGKLLMLKAWLLGEPHHGFLLYDPSCAKSGMGLGITWSTIRKEPNGAALFRAIFREGYPGTIGKTISGTFVGTLELRPGEHPPSMFWVSEVLEIKSQVAEQ